MGTFFKKLHKASLHLKSAKTIYGPVIACIIIKIEYNEKIDIGCLHCCYSNPFMQERKHIFY